MGTFAASMAVVSAAAAIKQGQIAKQAYANDAQASLENAEQVEMQAQQKEIARKNQLTENLSSMNSMFAGGGVSVSGGSVNNIRRNELKLAKEPVIVISLISVFASRPAQKSLVISISLFRISGLRISSTTQNFGCKLS